MTQNSGGESQNQSGEQQTSTPTTYDFRQHLDEKIRGEKTFDKFNGKDAGEVLGKALTSYYNLEKHAGSAVRVPAADAPASDWATFYERLGVPKDAAGYGLAFKDAKIPEGSRVDEAGYNAFLSWARENGFTRKQVDVMFDRFIQNEQALLDAATQEDSRTAEAAYAEMQKEWGSLTNRNVALVQRGVNEFGGDEFATYLNESGLGNDPRFMRFAYKVFQPMMEDGLIKGENLGLSSADAKAEIDRLMKDPGWKKGDPAIIEKIRELTSLAHGAA